MKTFVLAAAMAAVASYANADSCFTRVKDGVAYTFVDHVVDGFTVSRTLVAKQMLDQHGATFTRVKDGVAYTFVDHVVDGFTVSRTLVAKQMLDTSGDQYCR